MRRWILRRYYTTDELRKANQRAFTLKDHRIKFEFIRLFYSANTIEQEVLWRTETKQPIHTPPDRGEEFVVERAVKRRLKKQW